MLENRSLKLDLSAVLLLAVVVFLAASLLTYHPADEIGELVRPFDKLYQQDQLVYPPTTKISNGCGWWGALAADLMFSGLGVGAIYALISLAILNGLLLMRRPISTPIVRVVGWLGSLVGLTTLATLLLPPLPVGPMIGPGGYLGALTRGLLDGHFALGGSIILAASLLLGGLMLCTDYVLFQLAFTGTRWMTRTTARGVQGGLRTVAAGNARLRRTDLPETMEDELDSAEAAAEGEEETSVEESAEPKVKVRGQKFNALEQEAEDEEPFEEPADEEEFEEEYDEEPEEEEEELLADEPVAEEPPPEPEPAVVKQEKAKGIATSPHFPVKKKFNTQEREEVMSVLDEAAEQDPGEYELPDIDLLLESDDLCFDEQVKEVRRKAKVLEKTFANFGFDVKVVEIETGPVIAQYEIELEAGLRLAKITNLADDLAIALRVPSVRIVAPIPGKNTVGIEVPNEARQVVRLREVIEETNGKSKKMKIPLFLGKDVSGNSLTVDLASLPHLLIAGRTGTGKSVCLNAIISSILMTKKPDEVRMLMIDPKMVELSGYGRLPHLMHPVVTDMRKAEAILAWAVEKMEERYQLLARAGVRHVTSYNQLDEQELRRRLKPENEEDWENTPNHLPFIVIVADEMADLMMTAGKEVEQHIIRLAQKSRAVGIHLILATQKPTVDVITGLIKSNLPARISFQVASRTDSRVVLDEMGADRLLGNGDMLFLWPGTSSLLRGQGTYLSDEEIERVVESVSTDEQNFVNELVNLEVESEDGENTPGELKKRDDLYESAVDIVVREGRGSVSLLQRCLGIGYGRAARLIDFMAEDGIVGPYAGSQAREVAISLADWEAMQSGGSAPAEPEKPEKPKKRSNRITFQSDAETDPQVDPTPEKSRATGPKPLKPTAPPRSIRPEPSDEEELEEEFAEQATYDDEEYEEDSFQDEEDDAFSTAELEESAAQEYEELDEVPTLKVEQGVEEEEAEYEEEEAEYEEEEEEYEEEEAEYEEEEAEYEEEEEEYEEEYEDDEYEEETYEDEEYEAESA